MTASGSINEELHAIDAPKIWLTRLFQPGTAANQSSANQISPSAAIKSKSLADQAFPNHAFLVGTIPHGKSRLNTAFAAMRKIRLREPEISEQENSVVVHIRHQRLSSPAQIVLEYLDDHDEITNQVGREITGLRRDVQMKDVFVALRKRDLIEQVPGKRGRASAWQKTGRGEALKDDGEPKLPL